MFNFSIVSLGSLILVFQNIFLLNEETLILICFLIFCWLTITKSSDSIHKSLKEDSIKIEKSLNFSLNQVIQRLKNVLQSQKQFHILPTEFEVIGNHLFKLSSAILNQLPFLLSTKSEGLYTKKFLFLQRLESQTAKLLALLLIQKLNKLILLQNFYIHKIKISNFKCFENINLLEYLKNI